MGTESKHEQIAADIRTRLAAIVSDAGVTYWYTPTCVLRVDDFDVEHLRHAHELIVQMRPGIDRPVLRTTGTVHREMELFVLSCYRWQPNTTDPYSVTTPIRWTVQSRLAQDIEKKLFSDVTLGGLALYLEVEETNREFWVDESFQWVPVELRVVVRYEHAKGTP